MKISFQSKKINLEFLSEFSKNWKINVYEISMGMEDDYITAFCARTSSKDTLQSDWLALTDSINNGYLTGVDSDFLHWNSYLLFIVDEEILKSDGFEFEIENDKFYMRKIVEHNVQSSINEEEIIRLLNRKILSTEIEYPPISETSLKPCENLLTKPVLIYQDSLIDKKFSVGMTDAAKEQREQWLVNELNRVEINEN